jgi:hypothetical protein
MSTEKKPTKAQLAKMIEEQAAEQPVEKKDPAEAKLDTRVSKRGGR